MSLGSRLMKHYRVPSEGVALAQIDPRDASALPEEDKARDHADKDALAIDALQDRLYAERRRALLVILQGTDASGKDGTVRKVFGATGPLGVVSTSFVRPTETELAHDFLWRAHIACPRRGTIGIFNRSYYEDVLVARVHRLAPANEIEQRYEQINDFERMLTENGTTILKFMLHISKDEQAERLQARIDNPLKRWKFDPNDLKDREAWDDFMAAYEVMLKRCSTEHAPWYVVPADRKWARNAAIAAIVRKTLEAMDPQPLEPDWDPDAFKIV